MSSPDSNPVSLPPNRTSSIRNPSSRSKALSRQRHLKTQSKLSRRLQQRKDEEEDPSKREERLRQNVVRTIEGTRVWAGDAQGDERTRPVGVQVVAPTEECAEEQVHLSMGALSTLFSSYPSPSPTSNTPPPRLPLLLTTSPRPSKLTYAFAEELKSFFGGERQVEFVPRRNGRFEVGKVCGWAAKRGFGAMVVIVEDQAGRNRSGPTHLTVTRLPYGPTAHFRLTSLTPGPSIPHHGRPTQHFPELVLSNFSTPLGLSVGQLLQGCFPPMPELEGRQVVSLQNQRDFIFVRRWRYAFAQRDKVLLKPGDDPLRTRLQELGPRFTLKLRWLKRGTLAGSSNSEVLVGEEGTESMKDHVEEERKEEQREKSRRGRGREKANKGKGKETAAEAEADVDQDEKEAAEERAAAQEAGIDLDDALTQPLEHEDAGAAPEPSESAQAANGSTPAPAESKSKKKRKRKPTSSGIHEAFLRGDDVSSASDDDEGKEKPTTRQGGGLADYMKGVQDQLNGKPGAKRKRDVEFEWKPKMGVSRRTFFL